MLNFLSKNRLLLALLLSSGSGIMLLASRVIWSGNFTYLFLAVNLVLAWLPLLFTYFLPEKFAGSTIKIVLVLAGWLLFFPNAPYLVTDLVHLGPKANVPLWFDIILLSSFAWNGLFTGFVSLIRVQEFLSQRFSLWKCWFLVTGILVASSFGVYLGRFERWNSWDVIARPIGLFSDILNKMMHPLSEPRAIGLTIVFSVFLFASYLSFYFLVKPNNLTRI